MNRVLLAAGLLIIFSCSVLAGGYLTNDSGQTVYGLRVEFSEPVTITGFGDILTVVDPTGESTAFVFTGGTLEPFGGHWFNWSPVQATIVYQEWLIEPVATLRQLDPSTQQAAWPTGTEYHQIGRPVADYSYGLAFLNDTLWMADRTTGYLLAVDPADGSVQSAFHVADRLTGVTCDGEYLWTCSELVDAIFRIDPASGEILDRFAAPGSAPAGLAWDGEALWCVDRETETLFRLSPEDGSVIGELSYIATAEDAVFDAPRSYRGLMWNSGYLYLVDSARRRVFQIDPKTGFVTSQIATPTDNPRGIAADGERFWYTDRYLVLLR